MKKIFLYAILLLSGLIKAQTTMDISQYDIREKVSNVYYKDLYNIYNNYIGVWENTTGNLTFRVTIWKVPHVKYQNSFGSNLFIDELHGKFMMLQDKGLPTETILYRSDKKFRNTNDDWSDAFSGYALNENSFGTLIIDNCITPNANYSYEMGKLSFKIINNNPTQARWRVKYIAGLNDRPGLTIPTDLILIKQ